MRHFYRTSITPAEAVAAADEYFAALGMKTTATTPRSRVYQGVIGTPEVTSTVRLEARPEGGHYTFVEVVTDQIGESRVDRNVKRYFVQLHRRIDPGHRLEAAY